MKTALCRNGAFFVNASRVSALKLWSQVLSIVISLGRAHGREAKPCGFEHIFLMWDRARAR